MGRSIGTISSSSSTAWQQITSLYARYGTQDYIGEEVSILTHSLLTARMACEQFTGTNRETEEVILAALLHDVGHIIGFEQGLRQMDALGTSDHENVGADYLRTLGCSERLCKLVRNHVGAKRYLVSRDPTYLQELSMASRQTLEHQGGPMNEVEQLAFTEDPDHELYLLFRHWEDCTKTMPPSVGADDLEKLESYGPMMERHLWYEYERFQCRMD